MSGGGLHQHSGFAARDVDPLERPDHRAVCAD
jgi:hypothetical protein